MSTASDTRPATSHGERVIQPAAAVPARGAVVEVIVENDDLNFDVKFPAETGTMLSV